MAMDWGRCSLLNDERRQSPGDRRKVDRQTAMLPGPQFAIRNSQFAFATQFYSNPIICQECSEDLYTQVSNMNCDCYIYSPWLAYQVLPTLIECEQGYSQPVP